MTGKRYYITTLGAWRAQTPRFASSHFILLDAQKATSNAAEKTAAPKSSHAASTSANAEGKCIPSTVPGDPVNHAPDEATSILVLIEADEGVHLGLEDEPAFEVLPHPLAQKPISNATQAALAAHGVALGATTFEAAEAAARIHPLLRHRVF
jgi:hypothetical protein